MNARFAYEGDLDADRKEAVMSKKKAKKGKKVKGKGGAMRY